jgi:formylglycine-generating enzyme required for sulfatase activity
MKHRICKGGAWLDSAEIVTLHLRTPREEFVDRSAFGVRLSIDTGVKGNVVPRRNDSLTTDFKDPKKYCVIDISKGHKANRYSVSYLAEAPQKGWSRADKTTKLVLRKVKAGSDPLKRYSISKDYYVAIFETTQRQWELIMGKNPVKDQKEDELPVSMVSYADICGDEGFAKALSAKANIGSFDLPTEAQWEYASRAGTTCRFATGNMNEDFDNTCWHGKNSGRKLKEVGLKQPNAWGIYDMQGNIWERCKDSGSPMAGSNPVGDVSGKIAANCGGHVINGIDRCRHGGRAYTNLINASWDRGFRIALNLK